MKKILLSLAIVLALVFSMAGCTGDDVTDPSVTTLRYEGGSTVGREFKECVAPGSKLASDDTFYPYPNTQRQDLWDSSNKEADHKDLGSTEEGTLTDNSGVSLSAKVNVQFFLNTDCSPLDKTDDHKAYKGGVLQAYHELVGKTRKAYFENDGTYGQGWLNAMNYYISAPVTQYLNTATKRYTAQQLWLNTNVDENGAPVADGQPGTPVQTYIADALTKALPDLVNAGMQTDLQFYQDFKVSIISVTPSSDYLDLFKKRQQAQVEAQTAQDNAAAQVAQAEADKEVKAAQAQALQEVIKGYGSVEAYLQHEAIENGQNPFPYTGGLVTTSK